MTPSDDRKTPEETPEQIAEHCLGWHKTTKAILEDIAKAIRAERQAAPSDAKELMLHIEEQIAFDLEVALVDGKIKPHNYVIDNRKSLKMIIENAFQKYCLKAAPSPVRVNEEMVKAAEKMIKVWAGGYGGKASLYQGIVSLDNALHRAKSSLGEKEKGHADGK